MHLTPLGDQAVTITVGTTIDEATHRLVRAVAHAIVAAHIAGIRDVVPAFASVTVFYDPLRVSGRTGDAPHARLAESLNAVLDGVRVEDLPTPRVVEVPVCYGGTLGPDLPDVARRHSMSPDDVISLHTGGDYLVYMVGFMPGFAYLGGLSERIATPRRPSPRMAVPAGTVGIGGQQTGVYPLESPGGWHLIGRTPLRIFDIARHEQTLLATGDRVRFVPISLEQYERWSPA